MSMATRIMRHYNNHPFVVLPADLRRAILSLLPANERALACRLIHPLLLHDIETDITVRVDQALPPYVLSLESPWRRLLFDAITQKARGQTQRETLQLFPKAARSSCTVNLEAVRCALEGAIFMDALPSGAPDGDYEKGHCYYDAPRLCTPDCAGTVAVQAGDMQLLRWLVRNDYPVRPDRLLLAAAQSLPLASLQEAWQLVGGRFQSDEARSRAMCGMAGAAAACVRGTESAVSKVQWLADKAAFPLYHDAAVGAARSGSTEMMRELWRAADNDARAPWSGVDPFGGDGVWRGLSAALEAALGSGHVGVASVLVDEVGLQLPSVDADETYTVVNRIWKRVGEGGSEAVVEWLAQRNDTMYRVLRCAVMCSALRVGKIAVAEHIIRVWQAYDERTTITTELARACVESGDVRLMDWLEGRGFTRFDLLFCHATRFHNTDVLRWLIMKCGDCVPTMGWVEMGERSDWGACGEVVDLLLEHGCKVGLGSILVAIARKGQLAAMQHLVQSGRILLSWDAFVAVVVSGRLDALAWAVEQAPVAGALKPAPRSQQVAKRIDAAFTRCWRAAAVNGDKAMLTALEGLGVPVRLARMRGLVNRGVPLPILRWFVERGALVRDSDIDSDALHIADKRPYVAEVSFLDAHRGSRRQGSAS